MKKIFLVLVVLMLVATLFISGCTDIDLSKNPFDDIDNTDDTEDNDDNNNYQKVILDQFLNTGRGSISDGWGGSVHGWRGQTFTTDENIWHVTDISLRTGKYISANPGDITISIRNTQNNLPTGSDIVAYTYTNIADEDKSSWITFNFNSALTLSPNTKYAIIVRTVNSGMFIEGTFYGYANGDCLKSVDNGVTWSIPFVGGDYPFKIWGYI